MVTEPAVLRMIFVRVDPADLTWRHHKAGESEYMLRVTPQGPVLQLDNVEVVIAKLNVFIRLALP